MTRDDAMTCTAFYHRTLRNADGTAVRCRANGRCKTWKTRPDDFRLPVKYGLRKCFDITPSNAADWLTSDPTLRSKAEVEGLVKDNTPHHRIEDW